VFLQLIKENLFVQYPSFWHNHIKGYCVVFKENEQVDCVTARLVEALTKNSIQLTSMVLPAFFSEKTMYDLMKQSAKTLEYLEIRFCSLDCVPSEEFMQSFKVCKNLKYLLLILLEWFLITLCL